ncbi:MAG: histidine phosphatase family protein [Burkholderiales bacterium]
MGTLYLVRHGQASFGAANYDQLSELGARQCTRLGEYLRDKGLRFDAVMRGTLQRQAQSLHALEQGFGSLPEVSVWPALNEYDSSAVVRAVHPAPLPPADSPAAYRHHFRVLRDGLTAWIEGRTAPEGMPSHADFCAGIVAVLDHVRRAPGANVLLVSSGGPIATAVAAVLGAPMLASIEINLRIRNSALTEFTFNPKRHALQTFNHLPHLDAPQYADWATYA